MKSPRFRLATLVLVALATLLPMAQASTSSDGLVAVRARNLDDMQLRPGVALEGYRSILVDPATVELQRDWLKRQNATRDVARWLKPDDALAITDDAADALGAAVTQAFVARGYALATAPVPGVLRLTPRAVELFVNAPYLTTPGTLAAIVYNDAGTATLELDVRDAATGELLGRVADRSTATAVGRFDRATGVSNRFWFDAMFSQWAHECALALSSPAASR